MLKDAAAAYARLELSDPVAKSVAASMVHALNGMSDAPASTRVAAQASLVDGFNARLAQLKALLTPEHVAIETLPEDLKRDWIASDGRARIEVAPKGDARDNAMMEKFVSAVLTIAPEATGSPVLIQESAKTVVGAFIKAAVLALVSITIILFIVLRRPSDVLVTLVPLLVASVVTLELTVLIDLPLNFANIIALPLLLGVGVAFKIYYVLAWRAGVTNLLSSSLTRAVIYSAMTTAVAFGSLCFSHHPGTSSMGKLLALALGTTLCAAVLFQPILMGPPRKSKTDEHDARAAVPAT
jgi:predicted RND superfamily exporter protein